MVNPVASAIGLRKGVPGGRLASTSASLLSVLASTSLSFDSSSSLYFSVCRRLSC